jgi:hypothetical protein
MNIQKGIRKCISWADYAWKVMGLALLAFLLAEGAWRVARHAKRLVTQAEPLPTADILDRQPWGGQLKSDVEAYQWSSRSWSFVPAPGKARA